MEAEQILAGGISKGQDQVEPGAEDYGEEEEQQSQEQEMDSRRESDGKENRIVATEKQYGDMPLCSPGSLLVCVYALFV
jgi:hypothetical protein